MNTKISILIALFLMSVGAHAQIDRSKQPQSGPAPKISLQTPKEFTLSNGLKVLVVENHKLPRVSFSLTIDNAPITEGDKAGVSGILGAMLGNGTATISKDNFNEEVDFLGARMSFSSNGGYASGLSKYSERILELMADAAIHPLLTEEEFKKERDKQLEGLKSQKKSVDAVASRVRKALSYGPHHPYGEYITETTLNAITLDNVNAFYQKHFNPNNAYLVVIGDVKYNKIKKLIKTHFEKWNSGAAVKTNVPQANPNVQYTQISFVDMPNAVQSNINLVNNITLKMSDPDYHAALIANKIFGGGFNSYLNMNLREAHGWTYGARSSVRPDKYVGQFRAGAQVRNTVTDSAVIETLKEIKRIKAEKVTEEALANAKAKYVGDFVLALEKPQTLARYALNIKINNLPSDFYETYLAKINAVTTDDVLRVANTYFKAENARFIVVGKGADVLENLEKTGIPIKYYDAYGAPVAKPEFSKPIPQGVTAQSIIDNYITAIGGKQNLEKVNTVWTTANVTIEGAPFKPVATLKQMAPNKEYMDMKIEGMGAVMKQAFNGTSGYMEQQGQKRPMPEEMIAQQKNKHIFPELTYADAKLTLERLTTINGNDVYEIKVEKDGKSALRYYNAENNLLVRTEKTEDQGGNAITTIMDFDKYSPVNGVQFPYYFMQKAGSQTIIFNVSNVKVNDGVVAEDFN
ncbi:MAG: insulinase family protein [Flavobacteriaceae bacterium]|nr:insulinase family protein [Flavobacteriaceae bacterium]